MLSHKTTRNNACTVLRSFISTCNSSHVVLRINYVIIATHNFGPMTMGKLTKLLWSFTRLSLSRHLHIHYQTAYTTYSAIFLLKLDLNNSMHCIHAENNSQLRVHGYIIMKILLAATRNRVHV